MTAPAVAGGPCPGCSVENAADHNYCKHCGTPLRAVDLEREVGTGFAERTRDRCLQLLRADHVSPARLPAHLPRRRQPDRGDFRKRWAAALRRRYSSTDRSAPRGTLCITRITEQLRDSRGVRGHGVVLTPATRRSVLRASNPWMSMPAAPALV